MVSISGSLFSIPPKQQRSLPSVAPVVLLLVFQTSVLITFFKSGVNEIACDTDVTLVGKVEKVWSYPNSDRLKIRVIKFGAMPVSGIKKHTKKSPQKMKNLVSYLSAK